MSSLNLNFTPFPELTTDRLLLRQIHPGDANDMAALRSDENVNRFINRPKVCTPEEALERIDRLTASIANNESVIWAIALKNDPSMVGTVCYWNISKEEGRGEIGYELFPVMQGKGIMQEAIETVIGYGFDTIGFRTIHAWIREDNSSSLKLVERNMFTRDLRAEQGIDRIKDGNDMRIYSLTR
jgi:[ribosomal protein S5]-alanine N-acetyltransferase